MTGYHKTVIMLAVLLLGLAAEQTTRSDFRGAALAGNADELKKKMPCVDDDLTPEERAGQASYMSLSELEVITEINLLRSDPAAYARLRLAPLRVYYHGKLFFHPSRSPVPIQCIEGVAALDESIQALENTRPLPPVFPCEGLTLAAREMTQDQGATKRTGHVGTIGSRMSERIEHYGIWNGLIAENISYGFKDPKDIVIFLLIDDGVPDRGHRLTLLDPELTRVGVSINKHRRYRYMCVMDFAASYKTNKP
jgi:hypothetical protein